MRTFDPPSPRPRTPNVASRTPTGRSCGSGGTASGPAWGRWKPSKTAGCPRPDVQLPEGLTLSSLAERPDLDVGVWETAYEAFPDIPYDGDTAMQVGSQAYAAARVVYASASSSFAGPPLEVAAGQLSKHFARKPKAGKPSDTTVTPASNAPVPSHA